jgi:hypothetical protein
MGPLSSTGTAGAKARVVNGKMARTRETERSFMTLTLIFNFLAPILRFLSKATVKVLY